MSSDAIGKFGPIIMYSYISNYLCFEYFVGFEITVLLGYRNPTQTIKSM